MRLSKVIKYFVQISKVSLSLHKSSSSHAHHHHHKIKKSKKASTDPKREREDRENSNGPKAGPTNQPLLHKFKIPKLDKAELSKMREAVPMSSASHAFCEANNLDLGLLENPEFQKYD